MATCARLWDDVLRPGCTDPRRGAADAGARVPDDRSDQLDGGRSLRAAPALEQTVGATRAYFAREAGKQPGDPAKAAAAIINVLDAEQPPLRLALGADAVDGIRAKHEALRAELSRWEDIARTTAFDV